MGGTDNVPESDGSSSVSYELLRESIRQGRRYTWSALQEEEVHCKRRWYTA